MENLLFYCFYYFFLRRPGNKPIIEQFCIHSFHPFSSTATSSAASKNGSIPEQPVWNEEPNSTSEERSGDAPSSSLVFTSSLASKLTNTFLYSNKKYWTFSVSFFHWWIILVVFNYGKCFDLLFLLLFLCRRGNKRFDVPFRRIRAVRFLLKMENTWPIREEMDRKVFISSQSRHFPIVNKMIEVLFPILYPDLAYKQLCFAPRKRCE